jgi:type I pantothenate kinase
VAADPAQVTGDTMRAMASVRDSDRDISPYLELDRAMWARMCDDAPLPLSDADVARLSSLGDPVDLVEVAEVYAPLARLIGLHVEASHSLRTQVGALLGEPPRPVPFVVGVAGSVAAGKSTVSRLLRELVSRAPGTARVDLVTTDGFLLPNAELSRRGLLARKGFPESYDRRALVRFVADVKAGAPEVSAPVYSHLTYDVVPGARVTVRTPDLLIVEGLNVLQPAPPDADGRPRITVSDFFDFSVYVDARVEDLRRWYVERFLALRRTAFSDPASYFARFAGLADADAVATAEQIWREVNERNLVENIRPTRRRATVVLQKGADHGVGRVRLRRP